MTQQQRPQQSAPAPRALDSKRRLYLAETYGWTEPQVDVIRNAICVSATDEELEFFLATCKRLQLDPFARQIWFVKRKQKVVDGWGNEQWLDVGKPETSIDGFRTIAERTGEYGGQDPIMWCNTKGEWSDVWLRPEPPAAARASVYRKSIAKPFVAVAIFSELAPYYRRGSDQVLSPMWAKMPAGQIAKCAESLAFRRGFPRDLSGIEVDAESQHLDAAAQSFTAAPAAVTAKAPAALSPRKADPIDVRSTEVREPERVAAPAATERTPEPNFDAPLEDAAGDGADEDSDAEAREREEFDRAVELRITALRASIADAATLDEMRKIAAGIDRESPEGVATVDEFRAKWTTLAQKERGAPKKR